ncbi:hypothetical protein GGQ19_000834 [Salinibacter ruber]|uniref:porin family protein n=1 Tax=Salinibacter ruber TaxID=146919 RepID=UPI0021687E93|nr:porin family protein [Salinibacter ruber]MCS3749679.1 hypothetical protein [Salinibacter ruber]
MPHPPVATGRHCIVPSTLTRPTRVLLLVGLVATIGLLRTGSASAQVQADTTAACTDRLDAAERAYRNRNFGTAVSRASQCTDQEEVRDETALRAYRLITLASLRQGALLQARTAVENMLQIDPEYTADPVNDPPSYDLFVSMVREDVSPDATAEAEPDTTGTERDDAETRSPSASRAVAPSHRGVFLKFGGGISDYTGDYPAQNVGHPLDFQEFITGSGVPFMASVELGYQVSPGWALVAGFQFGNYPIVGYKKPTIDDSYRYTPQLLVRYTFRDPDRTVRPYLNLGGNVTFGGERFTSTGAGPSVGGGLDLALGQTTSFYIESRFNITVPDGAIDAAEFADAGFWGPFDSVNQLLGVGLRLRLGGP